MDTPKSYYAFISYKREDKKEAKRLQHSLEYYKLPYKLRQENAELPEYVRPIFRDMTDLEVGELSKQIHEALEQSHYLIVICSPRAAQSKWVNDEIDYFISLGKQDKIIPYIIEGIPHAANSDEECYPPALLALSKEKELLGANINEVGKESAAIRVVSRMFNIRFDTLYQRYQRDRRRKLLAISLGIIAVFLFLISFIAYAIYTNNQLKENNAKIESQNKQLRTDSIIMAAQMDSIMHRDTLISVQKNSIEEKNIDLSRANIQLKIERDNVITERDKAKDANWRMLKAQSRAIAEVVQKLLDAGDIRVATLLALEVLPHNISEPDRPWTIEADSALRRAVNYAYMCHRGQVWEAAFSHDGSWFASVSSDKTISVWDTKTRSLIHSLRGHTNSVRSLAIHPDNHKIASASWDGSVRVWDVKTGHQLSMLDKFYANPIYGVKYSHKGDMMAIMTNDTVYVIDTRTEKKIFTLAHDTTTRYFSAIAFSPDDALLLAAYDSLVNIWNVADKKIIRSFKIGGFYANTSGAEFSPDGKTIATSSWDEKIRIWDLDSGKQMREFKLHSAAATDVTYSYDGKTIATSSMDQTALLVDPETGHIIKKLGGYNGSVNSVALSPDGLFLLTASNDSTVRLTPIKSMVRSFYVGSAREDDEVVKNIKKHSKYSPDGKRVISEEMGGHVLKILDVITGECVQVLEDESNRLKMMDALMRYRYFTTFNYLKYISFTEDGEYVAAYYDDGEIKIWPTTEIQTIITKARERYKYMGLTKEERHKYYLE